MQARVDELKSELEEHAHRYYVLDDPTIGDDEYDALLDELRGIEREHPELRSADSPTQRARIASRIGVAASETNRTRIAAASRTSGTR